MKNVIVRLSRYPIELPLEPIRRWMILFGHILREPVRVGEFVNINMELNCQMPPVLPIEGHRVRVFYYGISRFCYRCFQVGHVFKECLVPPVNWHDYLRKIQVDFSIPDYYFREWRDDDDGGELLSPFGSFPPLYYFWVNKTWHFYFKNFMTRNFTTLECSWKAKATAGDQYFEQMFIRRKKVWMSLLNALTVRRV